MTSTCVVCLEEGADERLSCGHVFHPRCILRWFQQTACTRCPTCRQSPVGDLRSNGVPLRERAALVRRAALRKTAPKELKRLVERLRVAETKSVEARRAANAFSRAQRSTLQEYRRLRGLRWAAERRARRMRLLLGAYDAPGLRLPPLVVRQD